MNDKNKYIALTTGEPAGIGPELVVQLLQDPVTDHLCIFADPDLLLERATLIGASLAIKGDTLLGPGGTAHIYPIELNESSIAGDLDIKNAPYVIDMLTRAVDGCLTGEFAAMVTAPVQKSTLIEAGNVFVGHTEFLAERAGVPKPVMMLANDRLRVALVTIHMPLSEVPGAITQESLEAVLRVIDFDLRRRFQISNPVIGVCGLNPHAGEAGDLGNAEMEIIQPAIDQLRAKGIQVTGPMASDSMFHAAARSNYDVAICMYHDQALIPVKALGFEYGINLTLGLPIIRTSPDHGTALDIAGRGQANSLSLTSAVAYAGLIARHRGLVTVSAQEAANDLGAKRGR